MELNIQANLKRAMNLRKVGQEQLAELSGVPRSTISNWFRSSDAKVNPNLITAIQISQALGMTLDEVWIGAGRNADTLHLLQRLRQLIDEESAARQDPESTE